MKTNKLLLPVMVLAFVLALVGCEKLGLMPPMSLTVRDSLMVENSKVFQVTNKSASELLMVKLTVRNKTHDQEQSSVWFKVGPCETQEFGVLEMGWAFMPGDEVTVEAEGYPMAVSRRVVE